jgi:hypothetical protein
MDLPLGSAFAIFSYVPLLFVLIGLAIAVGGVRSTRRSRAFLARARRVPGTITGVRTGWSGSRDTLRASSRPMLTFTTLDGRRIDTEAAEPSNRGVGNDVGVLYDPANPTDARVDEDLSRWTGIGTVVFGLIFALISFAGFGVFQAVHHGFFDDDSGGGGSSYCEDADGQRMDCPPGF